MISIFGGWLMRKNYSKQREEIKQAVMDHRTHPTAEEVYGFVKEKDSSASKSTVYRNLHELVAEGIIQKIVLPQGIFIFDGDMSEHSHAVCKKCGAIIDIPLALEETQQALAKDYGFEMSSYHVILEGLCNKCAKQEMSQ